MDLVIDIPQELLVKRAKHVNKQISQMTRTLKQMLGDSGKAVDKFVLKTIESKNLLGFKGLDIKDRKSKKKRLDLVIRNNRYKRAKSTAKKPKKIKSPEDCKPSKLILESLQVNRSSLSKEKQFSMFSYPNKKIQEEESRAPGNNPGSKEVASQGPDILFNGFSLINKLRRSGELSDKSSKKENRLKGVLKPVKSRTEVVSRSSSCFYQTMSNYFKSQKRFALSNLLLKNSKNYNIYREPNLFKHSKEVFIGSKGKTVQHNFISSKSEGDVKWNRQGILFRLRSRSACFFRKSLF